jgi:ubiquinol-cytochrome c reductase cytochrome c1 subunit
MKILITSLFFSLLSLSAAGHAASGSVHLDHFEADLTNTASLQRGARTFTNYCLSCHSASYMRYNRMAQDLGLTDKQVLENLMFASDKIGDTMTIAMRAEDAEKWFGTAVPDLSVVSRSRGTDWLYTYLRTFYKDPATAIGTNNLVFDKVGMPHVLWEQQGYLALEHDDDHDPHLSSATEGDLSKSEYDGMVYDLVNFLGYIGEPSKLQRLALGKWVLLYLIILLLVAYPMKKAFWKDIK